MSSLSFEQVVFFFDFLGFYCFSNGCIESFVFASSVWQEQIGFTVFSNVSALLFLPKALAPGSCLVARSCY